jgi:hypothetical protein
LLYVLIVTACGHGMCMNWSVGDPLPLSDCERWSMIAAAKYAEQGAKISRLKCVPMDHVQAVLAEKTL